LWLHVTSGNITLFGERFPMDISLQATVKNTEYVFPNMYVSFALPLGLPEGLPEGLPFGLPEGLPEGFPLGLP